MDYPESYELIFQAGGAEDDVVVVHLTARSGAGASRATVGGVVGEQQF